jgi:hypothetical protein
LVENKIVQLTLTGLYKKQKIGWSDCMIRRLILFFTLALIFSGCSNTEKSINNEQVTQSINESTFPADNPPIVGDVTDEKSIEQPIKERLVKHYNPRSVSDFEVTNYSKISKTIFCTINFKVDGKLHYGLVHAFPKDKGWVIQTIDEGPEIAVPVALQMTVGNDLIEENETIEKPFRIYSGYIHDKRVKQINITTTDDRMYVIKISEDQKQFLYVSPRKEEKAKIVALDKDGNMIYQQ